MEKTFRLLDDVISKCTKPPKVYAIKGERVEILHRSGDAVVLKSHKTGQHFPARFQHLEEVELTSN